MTNIPTRSIDQLPLAASVSTNDSTVIQQSGITKQVTLGTLGTVLSGAPNEKTLVIIGSSNAVGVGATSYSLSWAGLLTTYLEARGWTVRNVSVSGMNTSTAISRFKETVAIYRPSHVILCTALHNDSYNVRTFVQNTETLISMCRNIGAIPVVRGASPLNSATTAQFNAMKNCEAQLDQLGVWQIDALSTLVDWSNGGFVGGSTYNVDGLHCSDAGYASLYSAIDKGMFLYGDKGPGHYKPKGVWRVPTNVSAGTATSDGLYINLANTANTDGLKSFTQRAKLGGFTVPVVAQYFNAYTAETGQLPSRLRTATGSYAYVTVENGGGTPGIISTTVSSENYKTYDCVVVWRAEVSLAYLYINGVLQNSCSIGNYTNCSNFSWGGSPTFPAQGFRFSDCQLWSTPLSPEQVLSMYRNDYRPAAGLMFDGIFANAPQTSSLYGGINLVNNGIQPDLYFPWEQFGPQENLGVTAVVSTDASGDVVVNHGLQLPPSVIQIQMNGTSPRTATYHTVTSTSFTARIFNGSTSVATSPVTFNWKAGYV